MKLTKSQEYALRRRVETMQHAQNALRAAQTALDDVCRAIAGDRYSLDLNAGIELSSGSDSGDEHGD